MSLLLRLRECVPDDRELEAILKYACGGPTRKLAQRGAEYLTPGPKSTVYATVKFKDGRISELTPGPALVDQAAQCALVEKARYEAAHDHGSVVATRMLLAERKLTGFYKWREKFRIEPCSETAPVRSGLNWVGQEYSGGYGEAADGPPYPFYLQVNVPRSPNPFIAASRTQRDLDTYQHLLTLLVSGHIRPFDRTSERVWVLVNQVNGIENHLLHIGFADGEGVTPTHNPAPQYHGDDYYNHLWGEDFEICLPPSLDADLEMYHSLDRPEAQTFKRSIYWYALGIRNRTESNLSTIAFSTAIECLLPRLNRDRCHACNSELGSGPTHLFKAHLSRYGTLPESLHIQRAALYGVRSRLVHGGFASSVDTDAFSITDETHIQDMLLELVTRRSLLNWLRDLKRTT